MAATSPHRWLIRALWALPAALLLPLVVGPILRDGMFIDGMVYTNIAKNMARGLGSFWAPTVDGGGTVFYGHPPLLPYLESLYFRAFGNHLYTEDLYNATVFGGTVFLLYILWRLLAGRARAALFFFPLLLFALSQEVQLRYPNTLLECGMTLIILLATYAYLRLRPARPGAAAAVAGVGAGLAFLCKGPPGLFPLALPFLYTLATERRGSFRAAAVPTLALAAGATLLLALSPPARDFLWTYLDRQVVTALSGRAIENVVDSRLYLLYAFLQANLPGIVLCLLLLLVRPAAPAPADRRALGLLLVGASAILPLLVSAKQASYYQLPALPFFVLGGGLLLAGRVRRVVDYLTYHAAAGRAVRVAGLLGLLAGTLVAARMYGTTDRRDVEPRRQAAAIDHIMDSLGVDRYGLTVYGDPHGVSSALAHPLTGSLNRLYDIYQDHGPRPAVVLQLSYAGAPLPAAPRGQLLYRGEGVRLLRPGPGPASVPPPYR